jgi:hypothetical protein
VSIRAARFQSDAEVARIGAGLIDRTLPGAEWTHAAHWAAALWVIAARPDLYPPRDMPGLIRAYNLSLGNRNTDTSGYHETITQASLRAAFHDVARAPVGAPLFETCNRLLASDLGQTDWLLRYWSKPVLFSIEARRAWVGPDQATLPYPPYPPYPQAAGLRVMPIV